MSVTDLVETKFDMLVNTPEVKVFIVKLYTSID